jgi:hypothetical protein
MKTAFGSLLLFVLGYLLVYVEYDFTNLKLLLIQRAWCSPLGRAYFGGQEVIENVQHTFNLGISL